jgi:trigger factor
VNVTLENLAPCKKLLRVEVDAQTVDKAFEDVTRDFQKEANLPGFRPGKAPKEMVVRKYSKEIEDEVKRKVISDAYRQAVDEQKLDVLGRPDVEDTQFGRGKSLIFTANLETAPEFELPQYKGVEVKQEKRGVTPEDVEKALEALRNPKATFNKVDRPVQTGDIAVVNYQGTCEGKPITELAPTAKGLTEQKGFWLEVGGQAFIPGFAEQLQGAKAGDKRTVNVDFPQDFVTPQLAGKKGVYEVEVVEVKERVLPALDDEFAKQYGAENLAKLKEGVEKDLQNELTYKQSREVRNQIMRSLMDAVNFDLPESAVQRETRNVVYEIVNENARRGVPRDIFEKQKDQIYSAATQGAKERVKAAFLLQKIAEKEDIKVAQEEISQRVVQMAHMYSVPVEKFVKDLQQRNGLIEIYDQVMNEKVLDMLQQNAKVVEVDPAQPANPA